MFNNGIYISPKHKIDDYIKIKLNANSDEGSWSLAIDIFQERINGRYINLIEKLIEESRNKEEIFVNYSFSIMALNCLLIETLLQFYEGTDKTKGENNKAYTKFLTSYEPFKSEFSEKTAKAFYTDVRCGILHQAQTKGNTQLTLYNNKIIEEIDKGIRVDVEKFYELVKRAIEIYTNKILDSREIELKKNFINKMNYIADKGTKVK
jgi:hypothetical protein